MTAIQLELTKAVLKASDATAAERRGAALEKALRRPVQEDQPVCVSIAVQTDSDSDDDDSSASGDNSEVTYLLGPEFAIYVDSPLRAAYAGSDTDVDEEEEEEEEEDSSDDDQEESPRRRALGLLLDANVPFP